MWLLYFAVGVYIVNSIFLVIVALKYHNSRITKYNAIPVLVNVFQQLTLIPLMIKYF